MKVPYLTETSEGGLKVNCFRMFIYIPVSYFDDNLAQLFTSKVSYFGSVYVSFKEKEDSPEEFYFYNLGMQVVSNFDQLNRTDKKLPNIKETKFQKVTIEKDNFFVESNKWIQSLDDAKAFLDIIEKGKLPNSIPYNEIPAKLKNAFEINGIGLPVPSFVIEMLVSEINRNALNENEPFRLVAGKDGRNTGYVSAKMKDLTRLNSVFGAISFEDMNKSLKSSVLMSRNKLPQKINPLESVIKH